jgi:hypothetical protein
MLAKKNKADNLSVFLKIQKYLSSNIQKCSFFFKIRISTACFTDFALKISYLRCSFRGLLVQLTKCKAIARTRSRVLSAYCLELTSIGKLRLSSMCPPKDK